MTQAEMILDHMQRFGSINPMEATQQYGCLRLAARIRDLRKMYPIKTTTVNSINRFGKKVHFAEYELITGSNTNNAEGTTC